MYEITKTGKFITEVHGGAPAKGMVETLKTWVIETQDKAFLSQVESIKKKGETAPEALEKILTVFNQDDQGRPIIGGWMLQGCLIETGEVIFNARAVKGDPSRDRIQRAIIAVEPLLIPLSNGKLVEKPDGIRIYARTRKDGKSYFTAHQYINAGVEFEAKIIFNDSILTSEHIEKLLEYCGTIGLGCYRRRFGKFKWV